MDNSVRLATAMNCQSLLEFMISTCNSRGDDVVKLEGGKPVCTALFFEGEEKRKRIKSRPMDFFESILSR